jgi:hypothetical protein
VNPLDIAASGAVALVMALTACGALAGAVVALYRRNQKIMDLHAERRERERNRLAEQRERDRTLLAELTRVIERSNDQINDLRNRIHRPPPPDEYDDPRTPFRG